MMTLGSKYPGGAARGRPASFHCYKDVNRNRDQKLIRVVALLFVSTLILITPMRSIAQEVCERPSIFGDMVVQGENRAGEFRALFSPPDYNTRETVQRHLIFSTLWARLWSAELAARTQGRCIAVITTSFFPNLRVYLKKSLPARDNMLNDQCLSSLSTILSSFDPSDVLIHEAAKAIGAMEFASVNKSPGVMTYALEFLKKSLANIYMPGSVMQFLASTDPNSYQSIESFSFRSWLGDQRSSGRLMIKPLVFCRDNGEQRASESEILNSATLHAQNVEIISEGKAAPERHFRYAVVVGFNPALGAVASEGVSQNLIENFCAKTTKITQSNSDAAIFDARVRCLKTLFFNSDFWVVLFCDPRDCTSESQEKSVAAFVIAGLAERRKKIEEAVIQLRGPYLVDIARPPNL